MTESVSLRKKATKRLRQVWRLVKDQNHEVLKLIMK